MDNEGHIDFSDLGEEARRLADANPDSDQACMRMKKKLMALHLANGDMLLLLKGEPGLICRDLKRLF